MGGFPFSLSLSLCITLGGNETGRSPEPGTTVVAIFGSSNAILPTSFRNSADSVSVCWVSVLGLVGCFGREKGCGGKVDGQVVSRNAFKRD